MFASLPSSSRRRCLAALAVGGAALLACGCGAAAPASVDSPSPQRNRIAEERPPHPKHLYVATPAQEKALGGGGHAAAAAGSAKPPTEAAPKDSAPGSIPPASAGTNGSFVPPPPSQREKITPQTMDGLGDGETGRSAVLLGGVALAPPSAPEAVQAAIGGANEIIGRPYVWGGGHRSWYSAGYDCSGSVSYALAAGGLLRAPLTSSQLERWGAQGPGRWITVYANAGHTYAVIAGLRWDTVGDARGTGPRWHAALPYQDQEGFVARHPPGY